MFKTISAALLAVSVLAAPAMAAGIDKTAPVSKTTSAPAKIATAPATKQAPVIKAAQAKPSVLNANARMGRHHHRHHGFHKRFHKHMGANKGHLFSKMSLKRIHTAVKRG